MPTEGNGARRPDEIESLWALIARILAFIGGLGAFGYQAFFQTSDRVILLLVAAGMMGPTVAAGVAQVLSAWRGGGAQNE